MSNNTTDAVTIATEAFLRDELAKATLRVGQLEEAHSKAVQRSTQTQIDLTRTQNALRDWTREQLKDEEITDTQARELARIGDFTLSQNYDVTMTVEHTFTVCVEAGQDIEDILQGISFSTESYDAELMNDDTNVVDSNWYEVEY
jgi:hypothetical protein